MADKKQPSETKKHAAFVSQPISSQSVQDLPGVGKANADIFKKNGYTKATDVLAVFIRHDVAKDKEKFRDAIQPFSALNRSQYEQLYNGLKDYTSQNL